MTLQVDRANLESDPALRRAEAEKAAEEQARADAAAAEAARESGDEVVDVKVQKPAATLEEVAIALGSSLEAWENAKFSS